MSVDVPVGLGKAGKELWVRLTENLTFRPDEAVLLEEACLIADTLARLRRIKTPSEKTTTEIRLQQEMLRKLLTTVKFADELEAGDLSQWGRTLAKRRHHG